MKRIIIIALAFVLLALPVAADVPNTLNIQGVLMDDAGDPLADGNYSVVFKFWNAENGGTVVWSEDTTAQQVGGVFNAILGPGEEFYPETFSQPLWLTMTVDGEDITEPRIAMTSVATALRAWSVDPGAAVRTLNGMTNNVTLAGGPNVTITEVDNTLVISAVAGSGGDDGDWMMDGQDVYHPDGRVKIGMYPPGVLNEGLPPAREDEGEKTTISTSKLAVSGYSEGIYSNMLDIDDMVDDRHAIFGKRQGSSSTPNHGTGFGVFETNTAITGYNDWGHSYTFGVAGYTWFDYNNTGGVLGARYQTDVWGALAFRDSSAINWGMFTPNDLHVGGTTETNSLRMSAGANPGYILTSDVDGNASWQAPSSAQSDGDWTISGGDLFHNTSGTVALGTDSPQSWGGSNYSTTLQIKALLSPTLALDSQNYPNNDLHRWTMTGGPAGLKFNKAISYDSFGTTAMHLSESKVDLFAPNGDRKITLQSDDPEEEGGIIYIYGNATPYSTLRLDGHSGSAGGGNIEIYNGSGHREVSITANYNNTSVGRVTTPVLEITGGSDLSEQFDIGNASILLEPGMVVSIDADHPGQLTLSENSYDRRVAGVISGAGGVNTGMLMGQSGSEADGEHPVALVGRVYVWADASNGSIDPGDLLTTSSRPGHAMKVENHSRAMGAILGKAMTGLSEGQGLILTLVSLQ